MLFSISSFQFASIEYSGALNDLGAELPLIENLVQKLLRPPQVSLQVDDVTIETDEHQFAVNLHPRWRLQPHALPVEALGDAFRKRRATQLAIVLKRPGVVRANK